MTDLIERTSYFSARPMVLVIGCGDLGIACARVLGQRARVLIVDVDQTRLDSAVALLLHDGYAASGQVCDISNPADVEKLGAVLGQVGGVRTLAHVAAIGSSPQGWRKVLDVNLLGAHLVARAVGPHMVAGGAAIFMSSIGSRLTSTSEEVDDLLDDPFQPGFHDRLARAFGREPIHDEAYHMSKRGMNQLVTRLALEWAPRQVRALTISPGIVDTTMARLGGTDWPVTDSDGTKRMKTWSELAAEIVPLGRRGIIPEVSAVVEFMASDAASFVTGIDVPIDGGTLAFRQPRGTVPK